MGKNEDREIAINARNKRYGSLTSEYNKQRAYENKLTISNQNTDTNTRYDMHKIILNGIIEGQSKEEILNELCKREDFKKYEIYFENWINDQYKKIKKDSEEQER